MKKILIVNMLLFFYCGLLYSQTGWYWQNSLPTSNDIYKVQYVNYNVAYAVAESRTLLKTRNGGINWEVINVEISVPTEYGMIYSGDFLDLKFFNENTGYIYGGIIYKTKDGGQTWSLINLPDSSTFFSMCFLNENTGYILGTDLYGTTDGGNSWINIDIGYNILFYNHVHYVNDNNIYMICSENSSEQGQMLFKSTNRGANWTRFFPDVQIAGYLSKIQFLDVNKGYIAGKDSMGVYILKTQNAGNNWTKIRTGYFNYIQDFYFRNFENGIIVNEWREIISTTNSGNSWTKISFADSGYSFQGVSGYLNRYSLVGKYGTIFNSVDYGRTWNEISSAITRNSLHSVSFTNKDTGIAVGEKGTILRTTNGGKLWIASFADTPIFFSEIEFKGKDTAYISGWSKYIYKTTNTGKSWERLNLSNHGSSFKISFLNALTGLAVTNNKYLKTSNGGLNWYFQPSYNIIDIKIVTPTKFLKTYLVPGGQHESGHVAVSRTTDAGYSWIGIHEFATGEPASPEFYMVDTSFGFMIGGYDTKYKTANFFETYEDFSNLNGFGYAQFLDRNNGIAFNGTFIITTNGGYNWSYQSNIVNYINDLDLIDSKTAVAVGNNGMIIRIENLDFKENLEFSFSPNIFTLFNNYPNPFNPVTKIKFELRNNIFISLNLYNVLGEKLITVIDGFYTKGTHEIELNLSDYASGVYFYKLESRGYSQTQKMVYIK